MPDPILPALLREVARKGHSVFTSGDWNLNLVVQRSNERQAGAEDDLLSVVYKDGGRWIDRSFPCSADPGRKALAERKNPLGVAIIAEGQYRGSHQIGLHRGRRALVQVGPVTVARDGDRDSLLEPGVKYTGLFGINIHDDAGVGAEASEGCVVLEKKDMDAVLSLCDQAVGAGFKNLFTLTVISVTP
ncbi:MAG: hypothetical protein HOP09_14770 [Hyphomicrobium sp.]|nr:hypothetical protein [Hyphomicrobium sp.]